MGEYKFEKDKEKLEKEEELKEKEDKKKKDSSDSKKSVKESASYLAVLEYFAENNIQLSRDQINSLKQGLNEYYYDPSIENSRDRLNSTINNIIGVGGNALGHTASSLIYANVDKHRAYNDTWDEYRAHKKIAKDIKKEREKQEKQNKKNHVNESFISGPALATVKKLGVAAGVAAGTGATLGAVASHKATKNKIEKQNKEKNNANLRRIQQANEDEARKAYEDQMRYNYINSGRRKANADFYRNSNK